MPNQGHICIAITKSNMGGAQKYVFMLAKQLKSAGRNVTVLAGGNGPLFDFLKKEGIDFIQLENSERDISVLKELKLAKEIYSHLKRLNPEVLHLNSSKLGGTGALIGRFAGIKKIFFTAHGWAFNESRPIWQKIVLYFAYWITILLSTKTICVSKKTREQISFLPFTNGKTEVIHNGIEQPNFLSHIAAKEKLSNQFPFLDFNKKWIGVLAELHPIKSHDLLIKALSKMDESFKKNYQIVCMGSGHIEKELREHAERENVDKYMFFTGFVHDASTYLKAFESIILPSRSEALPLTLLEAGLAETFILASNVGGIPEIIQDGKTGLLLKKEDIASLKEKLSIFISLDTNQKKQMTVLLKEHIESEFSVTEMIRKTEQLYLKN